MHQKHKITRNPVREIKLIHLDNPTHVLQKLRTWRPPAKLTWTLKLPKKTKIEKLLRMTFAFESRKPKIFESFRFSYFFHYVNSFSQ